MSDDLLKRLQAAATSDHELDRLLLDFSLQAAGPELRNAVRAAAIPHWFDVQGLAKLLDTSPDQAQDLYTTVATLPFVETHGSLGLNLHERTRALVLHDLWRDNRDIYRELSLRTSRDCATRNLREAAWKIELIYHLLVVAPDLGVDMMHDTGWQLRNPPNFQYGHVEALARSAREHVAADRLEGRGAAWTCFWEAMVHFDYSRYLPAKDKLQHISPDAEGDGRLAAERSVLLADVNLVLAERESARQEYEKALAHYRSIGDRLGEMNCLLGLGSTYGRRDERQMAQQYFEPALALSAEIGDNHAQAHCLTGLGDVRRLAGDLVAAEQQYNKALAIYRADGLRLGEASCIQRFGYVHEARHEWEGARSAFATALDIYRAMGSRVAEANCLFSFGVFHQNRGESDTALAYFEQSKLIYHEIAAIRREAKCDEQISQVAARKSR